MLLPIALSNGEIADRIKRAIREYAEWLNEPDELAEGLPKPAIPQTEEDFIKVHPLTKFRAAMWKAFNNPQMADVMIGIINDCGMDIVVLAKEEKSRIII
jgi:hypothetical protein